jgi:hypothetical protein
MRKHSLLAIRLVFCGALVAIAMGCAGPSAAQPAAGRVDLATMTLGYTYYNRPGADIQVHNEAVNACWAQAAQTRSWDERNDPVNAGVLSGVLSGAFGGAFHRGVVGAALENCMVVRGWRVVSVPPDEGADLAKLSPDALQARLSAWVGLKDPHGESVRTWSNAAVEATTIRLAYRPAHTNDGQLSLIAATGHDLAKSHREVEAPAATASTTPAIAAPRKTPDADRPQGPLKANALGTALPGKGIIIVRVKGLTMGNGLGVMFSRIPPQSDPGEPPQSVSAFDNPIYQNRDGAWRAFAVQAGRWMVFDIFSDRGGLGFCLGAPSFEVKPGAVIYLGTFDLKDQLGPDLDLAAVRTWLAGQPQADLVKAADYTNGATRECNGGLSGIYALEFKGAPFAPSYAWGGMARGRDQQPAPRDP